MSRLDDKMLSPNALRCLQKTPRTMVEITKRSRERNLLAYECRLRGESIQQIAERFGVSPSRASSMAKTGENIRRKQQASGGERRG